MYNPFENDIVLNDMSEIYGNLTEVNFLQDRTVLVTGAYGMLASYICFFLSYLNLHKDLSVRVIAQGRSREKMRSRFGVLCEEVFFIEQIGEIQDIIEHIESVDYIIHAAGVANPGLYARIPVEVAKVNTVDLYYLLEFSRRVKPRTFLFFSSGDIYGEMKYTDAVYETDMGICDPLSDHACYTESKRMGETFCRDYWNEYDVPAIIARIGHTYGPTMDVENDQRVFASFMRSLLHNEDIIMLSDGSARRPFCYLTDAVTAFFLLIFYGRAGEAYNVCNSKEFISIREFAELLTDLSDHAIGIVSRQRSTQDLYVDNKENRNNCPVSTKLHSLGWNCNVSARQGFERVYRFFTERGCVDENE